MNVEYLNTRYGNLKTRSAKFEQNKITLRLNDGNLVISVEDNELKIRHTEDN